MEITAEIITAFRASQLEFGDNGKWPDTVVTQSLCEGDTETGGSGWGSYDAANCQNFKGRGMYLYASHWLKSMYPQGAVCTDNVKSGTKLVASAKSVGDESITYAANAVNNASIGDSWLASTAYGQQWMRLRKRAGMGARTTGVGAFAVRSSGLI